MKKSKEIVSAMIADLTGRADLANAWDNTDTETQQEIIETLVGIVEKYLAR